MAMQPHDRSRARQGNQNARKHGIYSARNPASPEDLATLARQAQRDGDAPLMFGVARGFAEVHGDRGRAAKLRAIARQLERQSAASAADDMLSLHRLRKA